MKIFLMIILSVLSGIFYAMGGTSKLDTKYRDALIPLGCFIPACFILGLVHFKFIEICLLVASGGLLFASLTTYWGFINPLFKRPKDTKYWWNWALTAFFYSMSALPLVIYFGLWEGFIGRTLALVVFTTLWSESIGASTIEEFGRGVLVIATLPLLLT